MPQRRLSWSAALRDIKSDRLVRQPIREERLRTAQGLRGAPALALSAWRGASGRRYVVGVHPITVDLDKPGAAVIVAARRGDIGTAALAGVAAFDEGLPGFAAFLNAARAAGATELHVHRLAKDAIERAAIVADLTEAPAASA